MTKNPAVALAAGGRLWAALVVVVDVQITHPRPLPTDGAGPALGCQRLGKPFRRDAVEHAAALPSHLLAVVLLTSDGVYRFPLGCIPRPSSRPDALRVGLLPGNRCRLVALFAER